MLAPPFRLLQSQAKAVRDQCSKRLAQFCGQFLRLNQQFVRQFDSRLHTQFIKQSLWAGKRAIEQKRMLRGARGGT